MKKLFLVMAFISGSIITFSQTKIISGFKVNPSANAFKNYEKGTKAIKKKKYQEGITYLTTSIDETPTSDAYFNRAAAYYYLGDTCNYCSDLKKASGLGDYEAQELYIEQCTYCVTIKNLSDSTNKSKNLNIKYVQIFHSKCTSDSTISYIYEKSDAQLNPADRTETDTSPVFTIVEKMPSYPGGENARNRFLAENIVYPYKATSAGIQGTVYVSFIIDANGFVTNVKVLRGIGGGCDEEAVRVVQMMPKWIPGKQNGKSVRVLFNMPITFGLSR